MSPTPHENFGEGEFNIDELIDDILNENDKTVDEQVQFDTESAGAISELKAKLHELGYDIARLDAILSEVSGQDDELESVLYILSLEFHGRESSQPEEILDDKRRMALDMIHIYGFDASMPLRRLQDALLPQPPFVSQYTEDSVAVEDLLRMIEDSDGVEEIRNQYIQTIRDTLFKLFGEHDERHDLANKLFMECWGRAIHNVYDDDRLVPSFDYTALTKNDPGKTRLMRACIEQVSAELTQRIKRRKDVI